MPGWSARSPSWSSTGTGPAITRRAAEPHSAEAVKALERTGWSERAETYGLLTGLITDRIAEPLVDAARIEPGMAVLDVGTGPGYAARRAAKRGAEVTGVDIADEVLARARRLHPGIRFLRGDAENLPFAEHSFDALVSNFTINHLPRPELAVREFARVLPPGGRIVLSAWDTPEHNRFLGILVDAAREAGLTAPRDAPAGPDPYRFAGDDEFRDLLADAGFDGVEVRTVALMQRVPNTDTLWRGMLGGSVRTGGLVTRAAPRMRTTVREAVEQLAEEYRSAAGLAIPARAKLAWGRR